MTVIDSEKVCIFIPFAGGSGLSFETLRRAVGTYMPVMGVTYKGRYQKNVTQAPGTVDAMANEVIALIDNLAAREVIIFGYSLGAIVAYEVARRQHEFGPRLVNLVVAACRAPRIFNCAQVTLDDSEEIRAPGHGNAEPSYAQGLGLKMLGDGRCGDGRHRCRQACTPADERMSPLSPSSPNLDSVASFGRYPLGLNLKKRQFHIFDGGNRFREQVIIGGRALRSDPDDEAFVISYTGVRYVPIFEWMYPFSGAYVRIVWRSVKVSFNRSKSDG